MHLSLEEALLNGFRIYLTFLSPKASYNGHIRSYLKFYRKRQQREDNDDDPGEGRQHYYHYPKLGPPYYPEMYHRQVVMYRRNLPYREEMAYFLALQEVTTRGTFQENNLEKEIF